MYRNSNKNKWTLYCIYHKGRFLISNKLAVDNKQIEGRLVWWE
jgi:hypothetical protein